MKANLSNVHNAPEFRFLSDNPNAVGLYNSLQMVRRVDAAGAFSWRMPKSDACLRDVEEWAEEQGAHLEWLEVAPYMGQYRHTLTVG